jgi:hypothetical protein
MGILRYEANYIHTLQSSTFIHSFINCSTVLVTTLTASHLRFLNQFLALGRTPFESDRPIAKASTYTGQRNTEKLGKRAMP